MAILTPPLASSSPVTTSSPKNNISASDFKRTVNAGHETNALAVANKQVDVATNNTENLDKLKTSAPEKLKELKVIWKSPLIPGDPIVWRKICPKPPKTRSTTSL
ncbi:phosphonate ABC transporter, substrate-binding protein [Escherichia coli]|uniref:Phosphonate ABC transporter, substrate-binding protein n=1 Tax=Escherichia coli TaxID=562 RepID=A0A2X1N1P6_ECOLX|nr:phosphonate ABC transporter, substrate-binding protein [Escherichia coli]